MLSTDSLPGVHTPSERIAYSAAPERQPLRWPGGARVALWVAPNIEHYEYLPQKIRVRNPWPRMPHPDILGYGLRDYGNRVGVWRLMEVFDRFHLPCTVSLSSAVLEMYPEITDAMLKRSWELMSHGLYNSRYHWNLGEDEERAATGPHTPLPPPQQTRHQRSFECPLRAERGSSNVLVARVSWGQACHCTSPCAARASGCCAYQSMISEPVAHHTPLCDRMYSRARARCSMRWG